MLMGIWSVTGSTRFLNLAVRACWCTQQNGHAVASKLIGTLVVKSQLFELVKGMLKTAGPTNTQKDGVESLNFCTRWY
eukprot:935343-Pelagomonas_calceolata.AAC.1